MATIYDWSTDPDKNNGTSPDGFQNNAEWSTANDTCREIMAVLRRDDRDRREPFTSVDGNGDYTLPVKQQTLETPPQPGYLLGFDTVDATGNVAYLDGYPIRTAVGNYLRRGGLTDNKRGLVVWNPAWNSWQLLTPLIKTFGYQNLRSLTADHAVVRDDLGAAISVGAASAAIVLDVLSVESRWPNGIYIDIFDLIRPGGNGVHVKVPTGHVVRRTVTFRDGSAPTTDSTLSGGNYVIVTRDIGVRSVRFIRESATEWRALQAPL